MSSWIVLITSRNTEFLKNIPEKALIIQDFQMRHLDISNKEKIREELRKAHEDYDCGYAKI